MRATRVRLLLAAVAGLTLLSVVPAGAKQVVDVVQIPYGDWLSAQGNGLVAWQAKNGPDPAEPLANFAAIDYTGARAVQNNLAFGFTGSGTITERKLADGSGEVLVNIDFTNAITWATDAGGAAIFGYTPFALSLNSSFGPGLSSGHFQVKYTVPDADFPTLNLVNVVFNGAGTVTGLSFHSSGTGPLRSGFGVTEGTPGECVVNQTGRFTTGGNGATEDGFPVEHVDVRATGSTLTSSDQSRSGGTAPVQVQTWGELKSRYRGSK